MASGAMSTEVIQSSPEPAAAATGDGPRAIEAELGLLSVGGRLHGADVHRSVEALVPCTLEAAVAQSHVDWGIAQAEEHAMQSDSGTAA